MSSNRLGRNPFEKSKKASGAGEATRRDDPNEMRREDTSEDITEDITRMSAAESRSTKRFRSGLLHLLLVDAPALAYTLPLRALLLLGDFDEKRSPSERDR